MGVGGGLSSEDVGLSLSEQGPDGLAMNWLARVGNTMRNVFLAATAPQDLPSPSSTSPSTSPSTPSSALPQASHSISSSFTSSSASSAAGTAPARPTSFSFSSASSLQLYRTQYQYPFQSESPAASSSHTHTHSHPHSHPPHSNSTSSSSSHANAVWPPPPLLRKRSPSVDERREWLQSEYARQAQVKAQHFARYCHQSVNEVLTNMGDGPLIHECSSEDVSLFGCYLGSGKLSDRDIYFQVFHIKDQTPIGIELHEQALPFYQIYMNMTSS
eukprot:TRINITY_DN14095_c0_g1_i3.p1 TRINITY_DN14095_c0_g1~~TRINITY_DN14095_c0_g1_i3.p1  ORF type:complete len:272 (-),score=59.07 TRINITY_DN14095_c0_g1_i3:44-859(-)